MYYLYKCNVSCIFIYIFTCHTSIQVRARRNTPGNTPNLSLNTLRINGYTSKINDTSNTQIESDKRSVKSNDENDKIGMYKVICVYMYVYPIGYVLRSTCINIYLYEYLYTYIYICRYEYLSIFLYVK
jgi:hypothetical protein